MSSGRQFRLLLWKDYLIRKRKPVTLAGILWASIITLCLYIVRLNIDNEDFPTCTFPARALPSAGILTFMQSFICSVNNECSPMDQFQEIPTYEHSKFTQLQRKFAPFLNETTLEVAASVPDALKLLATLADIVDEPTFVDISKHGLKVKDLFSNPARVRRYVASELKLSDDVALDVMSSQLSLQGVINGDLNRCSVESLSKTVSLNNSEHLNIIVNKLCSLSNKDVQKMFMDLLMEINFSKYIKMIGNMYKKISGDDRITTLGDMFTAVLRMMKLNSFLPSELVSMTQGMDTDFTYFNVSLISKLMDLFEPTFANTQTYKSTRDFTDTAVIALQYLDKILAKQTQNVSDDTGLVMANVGNALDIDGGLQKITKMFGNAIEVFEQSMDQDVPIDAFSILVKLTNFVYKWLPEKTKHDVLFYSTLLAKLLESSQTVIDNNMNIEELSYVVSLRNPEGLKALLSLPPRIVGKGLEALADAERTQILISKINFPGQMFCDLYKLQSFFVISKTEAESLKKQLCNDAWKNYVSDLIRSFGIFEVRDNINKMASLLIQETLGKDTSDQLYTIDEDFKILKNFTEALTQLNSGDKPSVDWYKLLNITEDSPFMKVIRTKGHLGKQILISVHGALAKEVVKQNPILAYKITPVFIDTTTLLEAINDQIATTPAELLDYLKMHYVDIVRTVLLTSLDEEKTYKSLSTHSASIMCNGVDTATSFVEFPSDVDADSLVANMCNTSVVIEHGMNRDSLVARAIRSIKNATHDNSQQLNWTKLINNVKDLYIKLGRDYPYLFEFSTYGMDREMQAKVNLMAKESKEFWFGKKSLHRSLHLCMKLGLRFLDILDADIFDITSDTWMKIKFFITSYSGPLSVFDDSLKLVTALITNTSYTSSLPPRTVAAISDVIPYVPQLIVDTVDLVVNDSIHVDPIISLMNSEPPWPCANSSLSDLLPLTSRSKKAIRAIETIICLDMDLQDEWVSYLVIRNATVSSGQKWNTTQFEPHLFLKFSSIFDSLIEDAALMKDSVQYVFNESDAGVTLASALKYTVQVMNTTERDSIMRKALNKMDTILNNIDTSAVNDSIALNALWENFITCSNGTRIEKECLSMGRATWTHTFKTMSVIFDNVAGDLLTYFREVNEPNAILLQMLGFTRNTGLYVLYDKMPEFIGVLLNSYLDYGFMNQIRRASLSQFWDCEEVLRAVATPAGSPVRGDMLRRVQPIVCPTLLHWISMPRGDNVLLDVVAKPQYYFYVLPTQNITSEYENAYTKAMELANFIAEITTKNETILSEEDIKINSIQGKLERIVNNIITYQINETDPSYKLFNEINKKQFQSNIYLTRIVAMVNKVATAVEDLKLDANDDINEDDFKKIQSELKTIQNSFKRRPVDAIAFHFDVITDLLWTDNSNYTIMNALDTSCINLKNHDESKTILDEEKRFKKQLCAKSYKVIYSGIQDVLEGDYKDAKQSLVNLIDVMRSGDSDDVTDVFKFLNDRKQLISNLKKSIKYSYDVTLPIYLKYLQSNLHHYDVVLSFLAGDHWWEELTQLYNGPHAERFFGYLERSFEVTEDVLTNFDRIHLVRLLRDINVNRTDAFCQPNITLAEYLPDRVGALAHLKTQICAPDNTLLLQEIPPLVFASQGYNTALKLSQDINYTSLYSDISKTESKLVLIMEGPTSPQRPRWVTDDKLKGLREVALRLLSKETLTKLSFGIMSNLVDGGTLFLNDSQCTICSRFTTWFKQLNLQLFKKQEYDNLLCHMSSMTLQEIYETLNNDFHWDMAITELISTRNYTKYEMNKSMNEFLELVKLHLLEDIAANTTKLTKCLASNVTRNEFGNATLLLSVTAHIAKLLRSEMSHLHTVEGIKDVPYLQSLRDQISQNLDVLRPLDRYLKNNNTLVNDLLAVVDDENIVDDVGDASINLRTVRSVSPPDFRYMRMRNTNWQHICETYNCSAIFDIIDSNLNTTLIERDLPKLETEEFWRFTFVRNILEHMEGVLSHGSRLLGVGSMADAAGVANRGLAPLIDMMMLVLADDTVDTVLFSLHGLLEELHSLLMGTALEHDLGSLSAGLKVLHQFKKYLVEEEDLNVAVSQLFPNPEAVERGLSSLGINNTNFWSIAAPRIQAGHINLKPLLSSKQGEFHVADYVCQVESMSRVIVPANLDVVTADDVYGAVLEQFCGMDDQQAKEIIPVLLENFNFSVVFDKVKDVLLTKLYTASNLTAEEGATVLAKYPQMSSLLPALRENIGDLSESLANEPLFQSLKNFTSLGGLLDSSEFFANAGTMVCGKPFDMNMNRLYKSIAATPDFADQPDQAQLDVLPTDFCRSLYKDILSIGGGKIVWSFVKPLIMGKILYTPSNPVVDAIIQKANATFAQMTTLTNILHSFARSFSSVERLSTHREGISVLRAMMTAPELHQLRLMMMGDDADGDAGVPNVDVEGLFEQFGDLKDIGGLLNKASNLVQCINLNRFRESRDEAALTHEAAVLSQLDDFSAGIVFLNTENQEDIPLNIEYKIRMDIDNVPTTSRMKNYLWIPGPEASFIENMRYFRGFIQIQDIIDKAIIQLSRSRVKRETRTEDETKWAVYTQQMPYPCYRKDFFQTSLYESQALMVAFFFSMLFTVASAVRFIVADNESGNTMLMSVMGVDLRWHTLSWFSASLAEMAATCGGITLVLHAGQVLPRTDPTLVFALLLLFGLSVLSFCYMISKLFSSASFGAVCAAIAYLITFMPFVMILSLEAVLTSTLKIFVCMSMSSALCYSFLYITRLEAMGGGARWGGVMTSPPGEDMSIALAAAMMAADAAFYCLIGYLIDRFNGPKTLQSNITNCVTSGEKAGVSIVNISKVFGDRVALDNVSIELHQGHITTLLGHNGAGKTTLINILTGMMKPTKGHVIIRSEHSLGAKLGVCPQKDVLFEYMTAREHLALYAQLKSGLPLDQVQDEVDRMMSVLGVHHQHAGGVPVVRLSGGTRRRVCVALAFVARPPLVSLDEPTAGVDPAARRDIWSMIMNLKEDRTILLTTHHLDEAELLSDQIVIMHKGQVHTTGSPIEIKRSLGSGYKLTVMYDTEKREWTNTNGDWTNTKRDWTDTKRVWTNTNEDWTESDEDSIEEKTKRLVTFVRDIVKNASVVDVNGGEVEIALPFFDDEGVNNNYLELCSKLESGQAALGHRSYSLDCTSLEQVFYNICNQADTDIPDQAHRIHYVPDAEVAEDCPSKSTSTSSIKTDRSPLVPAEGPLSGTLWAQFLALIYARYLHHIRNRQLMFMLVVLPSLFVTIAMGFSTLRPPADNEISLPLTQHIYEGSTQFLVPNPSIYSKHIDPTFAHRVMDSLRDGKQTKNWTSKESPTCKCVVTRQECDIHDSSPRPEMMLLPDVNTLNHWLVDSQEVYIEKRYTGFTSSIKENGSALVAWYNNKGHHAMPAALSQLNTAILRSVSRQHANITTYTHPLKISKEQISKDTVYQHIADAGISGLVLVAYSLVSAGGAVYLVSARRSQEKRLQLLCGVPPALYWATALCWDMIIIFINMVITAVVMKAFGFPVFVAGNNLPAICVLLMLYGYACGCLVHVAEKWFSEASLANMMLFCGNAFLGLAGLTVLLILDIISDSDETDNARWVLHKIFMLSPQFALGDGLLEIAKNTIQAQVLSRFGMDTYRDPLTTGLVLYHYIYLVAVGTLLMMLNLAIEYDCFEVLLVKLSSERIEARPESVPEAAEVVAERARVVADRERPPLTLNTIGNINRGFVHTEAEGKKSWLERSMYSGDVLQVQGLAKLFPAVGAHKVAVRDLTLGIPAGQCTALLGQNGAGKSTTFSMLTGETRPSRGNLYLNDQRVSSGQLCRGLISYCPQSDAIDPLLTVRETLAFYCRLRGISDQEVVIKRTVEMFELSKYVSARSGTLSGGNKRKLCAAIAFMGRAPLVLLDEPTSGMDPLSRGCVTRGVRAACGAGGVGSRAVLLSTHALQDARRVAARVAFMRAGDLLAIAPLDECLNRFGGGYVVQCRVGAGAPGASSASGAPSASSASGAPSASSASGSSGAPSASGASGASGAWRAIRAAAPQARLTALHRHTVHFLLPTHYTVGEKESTTRLSDVFRLMSELQESCDIEDYTVNQSSLDQMFLSFTDKAEVNQNLGELDLNPGEVDLNPGEVDLNPGEVDLNPGEVDLNPGEVELPPSPSPSRVMSDTDQLDSITSL